MPPTGRRRARKDETTAVDNQIQDVVATPSRKRRRLNGAETKIAKAPAATRASAETEDTVEENGELSDAEIVDEVIRHLRIANYKVNAVDDYNNSIVEPTARAFAKVAGQNWTYYVTETSVVIGRPNKPKRESGVGVDGEHPTSDSEYRIDIDLGPDMQVSRFHAKIEFDSDAGEWMLIVNGRNGAVLDERRLERGQRAWLRSGMVINVLGTQMMFLLPEVAPEVHPEIKKMLLTDEDPNYEEDMGEEKAPRSQTRGPRGRQSNIGAAGRGQPASTSHGSQQTIAATSSQQIPGTPVNRNKELTQPKSSAKQSPAYGRGLIMEGAEEIDYSAESARDIKPPLSYAAMIGQAILASPEENATLAKIYDFIKEKYAFYRFNGGGWQNSIRHNLSLSKHFEKIPRRTDEPGKGMKWQIVAEYRDEFMKKNTASTGKKVPRRLDTSGPNSPAGSVNPVAQSERLQGVLDAANRRNSQTEHESPRSATPPLAKFPSAAESYTPDRGPHPQLKTNNLPDSTGGIASASSTELTPGRPPILSSAESAGSKMGTGLTDAAINSPPTLSTTLYGRTSIFTPLVARSKPLLALQPSTAKPPSQYVQDLFSSPAPFWKYVDMSSTPARPPPGFDISPTKTELERDELMVDVDNKEDEKEKEANSDQPVQPSSPPQLLDTAGGSSGGEGADPSPTRTLSRPASRRELSKGKALGQIPNLQPAPRPPMLGLPNNGLNGLGPALNPYAQANGDDDDGEDEPIDLAK